MFRTTAALLATTALMALLGPAATAQTSDTDIPGAETAPVPPTDGTQPQGSVTMTGPESGTEGSGDAMAQETTPCAEDDADCESAATADSDVPGAETAPVPPTDGIQPQGSVTMTGPASDPAADEADDGETGNAETDTPTEDGADADTATPSDADGEIDFITVQYEEGGRYYAEEDVPTYNVMDDGTVDYPTYNGFRRYHSECHVCHGPDGEGSSYAPALKNSALDMDYYEFVNIVASGKQVVNAGQNQVMPSFGNNLNVMCFLDDMYVYLKARGTDAIPRGRPAKKEDKTEAIREAENECLG